MPEQQEAGTAEPSFREQVEAAEAQPEVQQSEQTDQPEQVKEVERVEKVVPLAALHEERQSRKELQKQLREYQSRQEEMQRQQVEMMRYLQAQQPQPQVPDKNTDPFGYSIAGIEHVAGQVSNLQYQLQQKEQQQQIERQVEHFKGTVKSAEANFHAEKPDYYEAVNWARQRKAAEYQAIGMDEDAAHQRIQHEIIQITQSALQRGDNPAQMAYRLAESMGYKPKTVSDQQKLQMQKDGQGAALPGNSGQGNGKLSLDSLAKLKGDDFLKATKGGNWEKLMRNL